MNKSMKSRPHYLLNGWAMYILIQAIPIYPYGSNTEHGDFMKSIIIYTSQTGFTKKYATIRTISERTSVIWAKFSLYYCRKCYP